MPTIERVERIEIPDEETVAEASAAFRALAFLVERHQSGRVLVTTATDDGEVAVVVPAAAFRLFVELLSSLGRGQGVTVAPIDAEITTQQAAELLNVSRPHLVKLLECREMPFHKVGSHRRVRLRDVLEYRERDDARRANAFREYVREAEGLGLYDD